MVTQISDLMSMFSGREPLVANVQTPRLLSVGIMPVFLLEVRHSLKKGMGMKSLYGPHSCMQATSMASWSWRISVSLSCKLHRTFELADERESDVPKLPTFVVTTLNMSEKIGTGVKRVFPWSQKVCQVWSGKWFRRRLVHSRF